MIKLKSFLLCFLVLGLSYATENVPGTQIYMYPPDNFSLAEEFKGFRHEIEEVQIQIHEMSIPIKNLIENSSVDSLKKQDIKILSREEIKNDLPNSFLMLTEQYHNKIKYLKWTLGFGNKRKSVFVVGIFQEKYKSKVSDLIKQSLLTVKWNKNEEVDLLSELPFFIISKNTSLRVVQKIVNTFILTKSERFKLGVSEDPYVAFAYSDSENDLNDINTKELSTKKLLNSEHIRKIHIIHEEEILLDGLPGYLIEVEGWNKYVNKQFYIVQCLIFSEDKTFLIEAYSTLKEKEKYRNDFMTIIKSFKLKD